jgi:hypothetical protein
LPGAASLFSHNYQWLVVAECWVRVEMSHTWYKANLMHACRYVTDTTLMRQLDSTQRSFDALELLLVQLRDCGKLRQLAEQPGSFVGPALGARNQDAAAVPQPKAGANVTPNPDVAHRPTQPTAMDASSAALRKQQEQAGPLAEGSAQAMPASQRSQQEDQQAHGRFQLTPQLVVAMAVQA